MAGEGRPSMSLLPAHREDVDADLRRHDDVEATVAPRGALFPGELYQPALTSTLWATTKSRIIKAIDLGRRVNVNAGWYYSATAGKFAAIVDHLSLRQVA
jgi:hypothetical protein